MMQEEGAEDGAPTRYRVFTSLYIYRCIMFNNLIHATRWSVCATREEADDKWDREMGGRR